MFECAEHNCLDIVTGMVTQCKGSQRPAQDGLQLKRQKYSNDNQTVEFY